MIKPIANRLSILATAVCLASVGIQTSAFELEEIVVTAQKREQNLQDVPVAVSAFTGDQLKEAAINDIFDLQTNTPGLRATQSQNNNSTSFSIRGVGTSSQNFGLESSVGMYVDGVYRSRQSSMISDMIDMEAVEVLRGPQGTLFGKNTPSGAVLFRTRTPSHETDGYASVTGGSYGMLNASAAANLSIIDDVLAVRGTVFSSERDGFIDVDGFGDEVLNDRNRWGTRLQALITPNDDLSIRVIADYSEIDEICCGALGVVDNFQSRTRTDLNGDPVIGSDTHLTNLGGTIRPGDQSDNYNTALNYLPKSQAEDKGLSMEISWERGDYNLTSVTSYRKFESLDIIDSDYTNVDVLNVTNDANQKSFSQEFRIDYSSDNLNAVLGVYYFEQDIDLDYSINDFGGTELDEFTDAAFGFGNITNAVNIANAFGGAIAPGAQAFPDDFVASHKATQEQSSWAIFGQFDYDLTETLVLTAGLRYTEEEKDLSTVFNETLNGAPWVPGDSTSLTALGALTPDVTTFLTAFADNDLATVTAMAADTNFTDQLTPYTAAGWGGYLFAGYSPRDDINTKLTDEQITGTIKLSWMVNNDFMIYASYGTGYKSGGTNTDRIPAGFEPVFDAETSESFEIGIKSEFPDQALRVNLAAHYTTVDDFQANSFSGTGFVLQNAGELETYGAELEVFWQPAENTTVTLAYAYSIADFKEFEKAGCYVAYTFHTGQDDPGRVNPTDGACDRSGDRIDSNPEHYATLGLKQELYLADGIEGYVFGEYTYIGDMVLDQNQDPYKTEDSYGLLNLRAGVHFEEYDIDLTVWGRNVLDENYKRTTYDVPLQDGKLMTYPSDPRTYGITLNKNF